MASLLRVASVLLFALTSSEGLCPQGGDVVIHKDYKSGEQLCCQAIRCPRGQEAVACSPEDPYSTTCRPCPENTFQLDFTSSVDMIPCSIKQSCRDGMKVENDQSSVKDRKCVCDVQLGLCNSSRSRSQFCQLGNCSAGLQLNPDCSCSECENGFFKEANSSSQCRKWRNCEEEGLETLLEGSAVTDRVCRQQTDDPQKNPPPSPSPPSASVPTNSNMPNTTEIPGRNESSTRNDGDTKPWTYISIACIGIMLVLLIALVVWFAIRKRWRASKNQTPILRPGVDDVERGVNGINRENPTSPENVGMELRQNPIAEEVPLLRDPDHPIVATTIDIVQLQTQPNVGINTQAESTIPRNNPASPNGLLYDWGEKLNSCRVHLVTKICYSSDFISYLMINNTITGCMKEIIEAEKTKTERIDKLMDYLPKRPSYAFPTLILALVLTDQFHVAKEIDADMAKDFKANRDYLEETHIEVLEGFRESYS